MSVRAEELDDWIGSEVVDADGEKLGKVTEVYYQGPDARIVEFRSGLIGHKFHLAGLTGATVSMKHLRLAVTTTVDTVGGLDADELATLAGTDTALVGLSLDALESGSARAERLEAAEAAAAHADALEADATQRAEEAKITAEVAQARAKDAADAEAARVAAQQEAVAARQRADELGSSTGV